MIIRTGVDIVEINEFKRLLTTADFKTRCFTPNELLNDRLEHLAGIFASKEAITKALGLPIGNWLAIEIQNDAEGKPQVKLKENLEDIHSMDLSITHSENIAIASFVALIN